MPRAQHIPCGVTGVDVCATALVVQPARRLASASDQTIPAIYAVRAIRSAREES
jgi:hypothetical protein